MIGRRWRNSTSNYIIAFLFPKSLPSLGNYVVSGTGISMKTTHHSILRGVEKQIERRIAKKIRKNRMKGGPKWIIKRMLKIICYHILKGNREIEINGKKAFDFGIDEFGRDVYNGVISYLKVLKKRDLDLNAVLVLGSRAKGRGKPKSDVDLLVIASNLPKGLKRHLVLLDNPIWMGIEPCGCTKEEFLRWLEEFRLIALDAMYYGKLVYDDGFWSEAKKKFTKMEKKYALQKTNLKERLSVI